MRSVLLAFVLLVVVSVPSWAGDCPGEAPGCGFSRCATPAVAVPSHLWIGGSLQPVEESLPRDRDSTGFNEFTQRYSLAHPQWFGLDIKPPYLYALAAWGLQVWDLADPGLPRRVSQVDGPSGLRTWSDNPEVKQPLRWISISGSTAAVVGVAGLGLSLFDLTAPTAPRLLYQDAGFGAETVAATTVAGRTLVVVPTLEGARLYDATSAGSLSRCLEGVDACGGVRLPGFGRPSAVYAAALGPLLALSYGSSRGLELYDLGDPAHPHLMATAASGEPVGGVALFEAGGERYLAYRPAPGLAIARISGSALETVVFVPLADGGNLHFLTVSTSAAGPVLYVGSDNRCSGGPQREWLFDVSDPRNPRDLTPDPVGGEGYWGWYYRGNPMGFNNVMPRTGKFLGEYFYRAALSILDVHRRTGSGPAALRASFAVEPALPEAGRPVTFRSTSTGGPEIWEWLAPEGDPLSGLGELFPTRFATPGSKEVSLTVCNRGGCDTATRSVVLSGPGGGPKPAPSFRIVPTSPRIGETAQATDTSLNHPTSWLWSFPGGTPSTSDRPSVGTKFAVAGTKDLSLTVCNGAGCVSLTQSVTVRGAAGGGFEDVPPDRPAAAAIAVLVGRGLLAPCSPGHFCPDAPASRREIAVTLGRLSASRPPKPARGLFVDLPRRDPAAPWIEDLYRQRRIDPCGTKPLRFCPAASMQRGAVPAWFLRTLRGADYVPPEPLGVFSDLPARNPFAAWVEEAYAGHLVEPCGTAPPRFCVRRLLSRADLALWLVDAFRLL